MVGAAERRRTSRWRKPEQLRVAIADVSTSGVGFYGPQDPVLMVSEAVALLVEGTVTEVRVRWVDPGLDGEFVRYGAEFMEGFPALVPLLEEKFSLNEKPQVPPRD
jgi:hypothetical protein